MSEKKNIESLADATVDQSHKVEITTDGYIFITLSKEALQELWERAKDYDKAVIIVHAPQLICN